MSVETFALWLLRTVGGQAVKNRFNRRGLNTQLRSLQKALLDSQDDRDRLRGVEAILERVARDRDTYFADIVRLRAENVVMRDQLARRSNSEP